MGLFLVLLQVNKKINIIHLLTFQTPIFTKINYYNYFEATLKYI